MTPEMLVSMATHPSGSYLLEAFMKSTVIGEKKKDQYVEKFKVGFVFLLFLISKQIFR